VDLGVTETGSGEPLVLLVHGVLDRGRSFAAMSELLADECRMLTYDRRGYGSSADAPGAPVDVKGHITDVLTVLDGRPAVVVGHSFGGVIAAGAAVRAPELVQALVMYESGPAWAPGWDDTTMLRMLGGPDPAEAGLQLMIGDRFAQMSEEQQARWRGLAEAFVAEESSTRLPDPPFAFADLRMPVVYGASEEGPFAPIVAHLQDVVADLEVVRMPGAGHHAHRDAPAEFADLVRRALRRAQPG